LQVYEDDAPVAFVGQEHAAGIADHGGVRCCHVFPGGPPAIADGAAARASKGSV
jgi:hypothetical protein